MTTKKKKTVGVKFDGDKPGMASIPKDAMWEMGKALSFGATRYGDHNYRQGMKVGRCLAAAVRHIYQHLDGEDIDSDSGNMHLGHAMASVAMAIYILKNKPEFDDRFEDDKKKYKSKKSK